MGYIITYFFVFSIVITCLLNAIYYIFISGMSAWYIIKNKKTPNLTPEDLEPPLKFW